MNIKTIRGKAEGEDFLGLITFGSLIANVFQLVSGESLERRHAELKKYAKELQRCYQGMLERYSQVSKAYDSMKKVNEELSNEVSTLNGIIGELRKENNRLLGENAKIKTLPEKRRRNVKN